MVPWDILNKSWLYVCRQDLRQCLLAGAGQGQLKAGSFRVRNFGMASCRPHRTSCLHSLMQQQMIRSAIFLCNFFMQIIN